MNVSESKSAVRSEINVTPLVDVCLVLLIIFMVVTPLITKQVDVQLPQTPGPGKFPPSELIQVTIQESGSIWIDDRLVPRELLASTLRDMAPTEKPVAVAGDGRLPYREVRLVLELIQQAGFQHVGLIAERQGA